MKLVSMPIIAAGLAELRHGRFSFYPAIVGIDVLTKTLEPGLWKERT